MEKFKTLNGYEVKDEFARNQSQNALTRIGDLTELDTTDKTSVVNAINEINSKESGSATDITNLSGELSRVETYLGYDDTQTFDDDCFWAGETFVSEIHNIMQLLNNLWWIYDVGSLQIANSMSYMYSTTIEQPDFYFANATIGGNQLIENRVDLSSKNVERTIVKTTYTFASSGDTLSIPIFKVHEYTDVTPGTDPFKVVIDDVYSINTTVEYDDQDLITICDGNQVFHATQCFMYLEDDSSSPNYNWYVLAVQPKNSSGIIGNSAKVIVKVEYSTKKETIVNP